MGKHYSGETGTEIRLNCGCDISAASATVIYCRKPSGTTATWTATVYGTNYIRYYTGSTDLNETGVYRVQAGITLGTWTGRGETAIFEISPDYV